MRSFKRNTDNLKNATHRRRVAVSVVMPRTKLGANITKHFVFSYLQDNYNGAELTLRNTTLENLLSAMANIFDLTDSNTRY